MAVEELSTQAYDIMGFGGYGQRYLSAETAVATEHFCAITVLTDASLTYTNDSPGGDASQTTLALTAGITIYGDMTALDVVSGSVMAYLIE